MSDGQSGLVPVDTGLVLQTLVEKIFEYVEARRDEDPSEPVAAVLAAHPHLVDTHRRLEADLRHAGYLARAVEVELFEPARQPAVWLSEMLTERFAATVDWHEAVAGTCDDLSRSEPLDKPSPNDAAAMSWRVPGPGGHVRHYVARRTIEDYLRDAEAPVAGDPAELKRPWLYGFFVRSCEEALPAGAALAGGD